MLHGCAPAAATLPCALENETKPAVHLLHARTQVKAEFKERQALERSYDATLQRREDMLYHIGGAQQRGEHHQAAVLEKQLIRVDGDLDLLEERLRDLDARHSGKRPKLKI